MNIFSPAYPPSFSLSGLKPWYIPDLPGVSHPDRALPTSPAVCPWRLGIPRCPEQFTPHACSLFAHCIHRHQSVVFYMAANAHGGRGEGKQLKG